MSAAIRIYPISIHTLYGDGWLIGRDPANHQVNVQFTREKCTDAAMLAHYRGDNWTAMIPETDILESEA